MMPKTFNYSIIAYTNYYDQRYGNIYPNSNGYVYGFIGAGHYNYQGYYRIVKYNPTDMSEAVSVTVSTLKGAYTNIYSLQANSSYYTSFNNLTVDNNGDYLITGMDYYYGNNEFLAKINKDTGVYTIYNFRTHNSLKAFYTKYTTAPKSFMSAMLSNPTLKYQDSSDGGFRFIHVQSNSTVGATSGVVIGKMYLDGTHISYGIDFNLSSAYYYDNTYTNYVVKDKSNRFYFVTKGKGSTGSDKKFYLHRVSETGLEENILQIFDFSDSAYSYNYMYDMYFDEDTDCIYMTGSKYEMTQPATGTEYSHKLVKFNTNTLTVEKSQNISVPGGNITSTYGKLSIDKENRLFWGFCNGSNKVDSYEGSINKFFTINMDTFQVKYKRHYQILTDTASTIEASKVPNNFPTTNFPRLLKNNNKYYFYGSYSSLGSYYNNFFITQQVDSMLVPNAPDKINTITAERQFGYLSNLSPFVLVKNDKNGYIYRFFTGAGGTPGDKTIHKIDPSNMKVVKSKSYPTATWGQFYFSGSSSSTLTNINYDPNGNFVFFYATGSSPPNYFMLTVNKDTLEMTKINMTLYSGNWITRPYDYRWHYSPIDGSYNIIDNYSSGYNTTAYFIKLFPYDLTKISTIKTKDLTNAYPNYTSVDNTAFNGTNKIFFTSWGLTGAYGSYTADLKKLYLNSYDIINNVLNEKIYTIAELTETCQLWDIYYDNETSCLYISWSSLSVYDSYLDKKKVTYIKFNTLTNTVVKSKNIEVPGSNPPFYFCPNGDRRFKNYVPSNSSYTPSYLRNDRFVGIDMDTFDTIDKPYLGTNWSGGFTPTGTSTRNNSFTIGTYDYFEGNYNYTLTDPKNGYSILKMDRRTLMPNYSNAYNEFLYYDNAYFDKSTNTQMSYWQNYDYASAYNGFCGKSLSANVITDTTYNNPNDNNALYRSVTGTLCLSGLFHTNEKIIIPDGSRNSIIRLSSCDSGDYDIDGNPPAGPNYYGTMPAEWITIDYSIDSPVGQEQFKTLYARGLASTIYDYSTSYGVKKDVTLWLQKEGFYIGNREVSQNFIQNDLDYLYDSADLPNIKYNILDSYTPWMYNGYYGNYIQQQMNANSSFKMELTLDVFGNNFVYNTGNGGYVARTYTYNITNYSFANFIGRPIVNTFYIDSNRVIV